MSASTSGCSAAAAAIRSLTADRDLHSTCWSLLGLPTSSEVPEVTRAYRRLSLLVHPDKVLTPEDSPPPLLATSSIVLVSGVLRLGGVAACTRSCSSHKTLLPLLLLFITSIEQLRLYC